MKISMVTMALLLLLSACSIFTSLTSNTTIKPNDSFLLGNNEHGHFSVKLRNDSKHDLKVYKAPISGGTHSPQFVKPNESVFVKVEKNTGLVISNPSADTAVVNLFVKGDLGLSMGYKN